MLPFAIPAEFDSLLSAANQYVNDGGAWEEAEERLRLWLAYQQTFDRTGQYPSIPPGALPELPADLRDSFRTQFLPEFQKALGIFWRVTIPSLRGGRLSLAICRKLWRRFAGSTRGGGAFLPGLGGAVNNLASGLSRLGRREEALVQAEEAVRIRRQLAEVLPEVFLPDLARSLGVLGRILAEERPDSAMESFSEAIKLLTPALKRRGAI